MRSRQVIQVLEVFEEPAIADPPPLNWRDWVLWAAAVLSVVISGLKPDLPMRGLVIAVGFLVSFTLLARRRAPLAMLIVGFAAILSASWLVLILTGLTVDFPAWIFVLVLAYAVFRWDSGRHMAMAIGVLLFVWVVGSLVDSAGAGDVLGGLIVLAVACLLGLVFRFRRLADDRAIDDARLREREQLARELHDSVAHHVSAIVIQAQAGRAVAAQNPEAVRDVLAVIEDSATRTLQEMRAMVGALRSPAELAPQAGVAELPALGEIAPAPMAVNFDVDDDVGNAMSGPVQAAVYRITQEAITNSVRHGREVAHIYVQLTKECIDGNDVVHLRVQDDGRPVSVRRSDGYGLTGMGERVAQLGGTFTVGPRPEGGWEIDATLPELR